MGNFNNELKDYQNIPRKMIFDSTISDRARFVFCFMAAKPDNWDFYLKPMAKEIGYSEETLRKYINELVSNGWITKGKQVANIDGTFGAVEYTLHKKKSCTENTETEKVRHGENMPLKESISIHKNNEDKKENISSSKKIAKLNWRSDYETYKSEVNKAKELLLADEEYKKELSVLYPNIDYYRTIIKLSLFWESERGWEYKKKSQSNNINMASTLKRNADKNIVYSNRNNIPIENEKLLEMQILNEDGDLGDGTFFKNGYRWYYSKKERKAVTINIKASPMPNEDWEYDNIKNIWYPPKDSEQKNKVADMLW